MHGKRSFRALINISVYELAVASRRFCSICFCLFIVIRGCSRLQLILPVNDYGELDQIVRTAADYVQRHRVIWIYDCRKKLSALWWSNSFHFNFNPFSVGLRLLYPYYDYCYYWSSELFPLLIVVHITWRLHPHLMISLFFSFAHLTSLYLRVVSSTLSKSVWLLLFSFFTLSPNALAYGGDQGYSSVARSLKLSNVDLD